MSNFTAEDYYIPAALSSGFSFISLGVSVTIIILVWRTKSRLHTINHLLICNTCVASIVFCAVTSMNFIYVIFIQWDRSDVNCRWRGYFGYTAVAGLLHSYLIQSLSRFFFSLLPDKYRSLNTFQTHYILILIQWCVVFLITSPAVLTKDISYRPFNICWIPSEAILHSIYSLLSTYLFPVVIIIGVYISIYYRVRITEERITNLNPTILSQKRDLEVLRNVTIIIVIFLGGGIPSTVSILYPGKTLYFIGLVAQSIAVAFSNLCIIFLDRELRFVVKRCLLQPQTILPLP